MTGYLTVGLILGLGSLYAFILCAVARDKGVVVESRYLRLADNLRVALERLQLQIGLELIPSMQKMTRAFADASQHMRGFAIDLRAAHIVVDDNSSTLGMDE